ncbi:DUF839 domain-containing protein [Haladaptatus halobius]|uniref:DUF839 domain-containing protein n=1 Tax=Haladaptatus halobius TaxID=2884875 RepID=UPI001D0AB0A9|nr:DUF839 domain-containing protein [Haladaptatus halobius]
MRERLSRRATLESLIAVSLGVHAGMAGARSGRGRGHGETKPTLNRFATTVAGAEFTGIFLTDVGRLFFNVQHPGAEAHGRYRPGAIGAVTGVDMTRLPRDFESVQPPKSLAEYVKIADGSYQVLAEGGDATVNGKRLGIPYLKSGAPLTDGANPDFNGFVPDDGGNGGYLFANWETQPGMMSRLTLERASDTGGWTVTEKRNLDFRPVEGTWNNCFETVFPWGTPLTSEEYEPDARAWFSSEETTYGNGERSVEEYLGYFGNAYRYGYIDRMEPVIVVGPNANVCGGCPYDSHPNSNSTVCRDCSFNPTKERRSSAPRETRETGGAKGVYKTTEAAKGLAGGVLRKLADASSTVDPENTVANPDNLVVLPDGRVVVGEDNDLHRPNMLWVYDPDP